ncbi:MAG: methyltransferase domain-containing protein [Clostridiales bacterium]|nr:methyltransferase domain-containing protein [Clostridiales bacterium]
MYEVIAQYYDLFMDDGEWIKFAVDAVKGKGRGADVGCGSGAVSIALSAEHDIVAIDASADMLRIASDKFMRMGLRIPTVLQKAEALKLSFKAEFITAMCDVVNYLHSPSKFFKAAYDNLKEGGVLVFDISSEHKLKNVLGNNVYTETRNDITYIWENNLRGNRVEMALTFFIPEVHGLYKKAVDVQTQYIHKSKDIEDALTECGFKVKKTDKMDRIYFVAEKAGG